MRSRTVSMGMIIGILLFLAALQSFGVRREQPPNGEVSPTAALQRSPAWESIEMVRIPGGTFEMGNPKGREYDKPVHLVKLDAFWIGKYELTQKEWVSIMGYNPGYNKEDGQPVTFVKYLEIMAFIEKLTEKSGKNYRLPTEAEWEYACRAGTTDNWYGNVDEIAWHGGNSGGKPHPVGQKKPNAFGLYDMLGNVWEVTSDGWGEYTYRNDAYRKDGIVSPTVNPKHPVNYPGGSSSLIRGGAWNSYYTETSSPHRRSWHGNGVHAITGTNANAIGFRLARDN